MIEKISTNRTKEKREKQNTVKARKRKKHRTTKK